MEYSENGMRMTERFEELRLEAYPDVGGVMTIGYGHTYGVKDGDTCSAEQAEDWLREDVQVAVNFVSRHVTVPLNQNQFDALVDFTFNVGCRAFGGSTMLRKLLASDYAGAANEFGRWVYVRGNKVGGLILRRQAEQDLFQRPDVPQNAP